MMSKGGSMQATAMVFAPIKPKIERIGNILVIRFYGVPVNRSRTLRQSLGVGATVIAPDSLILQTTERFPKPFGIGVKFTDITLVSPGKYWASQEGLDLAKDLGLPRADLQEILAIGETYPELHRELGLGFIGAVCLHRCEIREPIPESKPSTLKPQKSESVTFSHLPSTWWCNCGFGARTDRFGDEKLYGYSSCYYFAVIGIV